MPDYSEYIERPVVEEFQQLEALTRQMHEAQSQVLDLERKLEAAKERHRDISERQLPDLMDQLGLEEFKTSTGLKVRVDVNIHASIPKTRHDEAMKWLDDHGFGGLIKRNVTVRFTREQEREAQRLAEELENAFSSVEQDTKVESATLRAFAREQLKGGKDLPLDLFGIYRRRVAQVGS